MIALRALDAEGIAPQTFNLREPSLDDVFLSLTGHRTEAEDERRRRRTTTTPDAEAEEEADRAARTGAPRRDRRARMTTATLTPPRPGAPPTRSGPMSNLRWLLSDTATLTRRNLLAVTRIPEALFFSTVQPIMFVLLFRYVFGGAIHTDATSYVNYLMPGIFVQTVAFGSVSTSIGLAEDLQKGLIERFRALPMSRGAVLLGRTTADLIRNIFVIIVMTVVGLLVGFRPTTGVLSYIGGVVLILFFAYALSWGFAIVGLSAPNSETAQVMSFPLIFPLTFISCGVRAAVLHAELAPGVRHLPALQRDRQCLPVAHGGGGVDRDGQEHGVLGVAVAGLDRRPARRVHPPGHPQVPHPHLRPSQIRRASRTGQNGGMAQLLHLPRLLRRPRRPAGRRRAPTRSSGSTPSPTGSTSPGCPYSIKVILENLLRHEDGLAVTASDIEAVAGWGVHPERHGVGGTDAAEIALTPERVLMQDLTGVPGCRRPGRHARRAARARR